MGLDINTPAGQESLKHEERALEIYLEKYPNIQIIETDKTKAARVDGFMVKDDKLVGIFESRSRNLTDDKLAEFGSLLITYKKLLKGQELSRMLLIPFIIMVYLIPEDRVLTWQVTDAEGDWLFEFDRKRTRTQRSANGGIAYRENAFLPLKEVADVIPV